MDRLAIRAHHLLCSSLFSGHGYSGSFAKAMEEVVQRLHDGSDRKIALLDHPDLICAHCPRLSANQKADGKAQDCPRVPISEEERKRAVCTAEHNGVVLMDRDVLRTLGIEKEHFYSYRALLERAGDKIGRDDFTRICGDCSWHRQGLCSYESLMRRMQEIRRNIDERAEGEKRGDKEDAADAEERGA